MLKITVIISSLFLLNCSYEVNEQNLKEKVVVDNNNIQEENQNPQELPPLPSSEKDDGNPCGYDIIELYDAGNVGTQIIWVPLYCDPLPYIDLGRPAPIKLVE